MKNNHSQMSVEIEEIVTDKLEFKRQNVGKASIKTYVWNILLHGYELWIIKEYVKEKLEAMEMCGY